MHKYPYTDMHDANLDYIYGRVKSLTSEMEGFKALNEISYIGIHSLDLEYPVNAIVSDSVSGNAYLSKTVVPKGISLSNSTYWLLIFDYDFLQEEIGNIHYHNAGAHNSIYRGKSLGSIVTPQQWKEIKNGTFTDMYIGDYWTINNVVYRIAAFDYYLKTGDVACNDHHVVMVPDVALYNAAMNETDTTVGGYTGSALYMSGLAQAKTMIANAFQAEHILSHRNVFVSAVANGIPSNITWVNSQVDLMNEMNVFGSHVSGSSNAGTTLAVQTVVDNAQFPLFKFNHSLVSNRVYYWLRDTVSASLFACVQNVGSAGSFGATLNTGIRPSFCIYSAD